MIRVAVDAMGGDRAPGEIVAGALEARSDEIEPVLVGPPGLAAHGLELVEAESVVAMDEKPHEAVREKRDSSLFVACRLVGEGRADAVVSAGNTGAMLAAGLLEIRRLKGVLRPAIAVVIPARFGASVLIDAGANADARAEHLAPVRAHGLGLRARRSSSGPSPAGPAALDRRGAGEGEPADARGARAAARRPS